MDFFGIDKTMQSYLNKGAFVVSGEKPNVMTASWGMIGNLWGKKVVLVPIRQSRFTKEFVDKTGEFTLSVPYDTMQKELTFCGTKSGRDVDKFDALKLQKVKADKVNTYKVGGCDAYFECKVLTSYTLKEEDLPDSINQNAYKTGDYHTLYIAEIL